MFAILLTTNQWSWFISSFNKFKGQFETIMIFKKKTNSVNLF